MPKVKKIIKARSPQFSKAYATNAMVEETDVDVRVYLFNEIVEADKEKWAISDSVAILSPEAAVLLYEQLGELTASWKKNGKIVTVAKARRDMLKAIRE